MDDRIKLFKEQGLEAAKLILHKEKVSEADIKKSMFGKDLYELACWLDKHSKSLDKTSLATLTSTWDIKHDIIDELEGAEHYLGLAQKKKSREFLSMSKDELRHAHMLLTMQQRRLHELTEEEVEDYNRLVDEYSILSDKIKAVVI